MWWIVALAKRTVGSLGVLFWVCDRGDLLLRAGERGGVTGESGEEAVVVLEEGESGGVLWPGSSEEDEAKGVRGRLGTSGLGLRRMDLGR